MPLSTALIFPMVLASLALAAGVSLWSAWRWCRSEFERVDREIRRIRRGPAPRPDLDLMFDHAFDPCVRVWFPATE